MVDHDTPRDDVRYRHTDAGDEVRFLGHKGSSYVFSVGEGTVRVPTAAWRSYRKYLTAEPLAGETA